MTFSYGGGDVELSRHARNIGCVFERRENLGRGTKTIKTIENHHIAALSRGGIGNRLSVYIEAISCNLGTILAKESSRWEWEHAVQ